jgi:DNA relaxase NicK
VSFTALFSPLDDVLRFLTPSDMTLSDWVPLQHGGLGYRACVQRGNLRVYYDGSAAMGVHVSLSGSAVRQLEQEFGLFSEGAWQRWLTAVRANAWSFRRLDVALDDVGPDGVLDMKVIADAARAKHVVSLFRRCQRLMSEAWELSGDNVADQNGETLYFGRRSSDAFVRIYNKGAQQGEAYHHIRVELVAKRDNAEQLVTRVLGGGFACVPGIVLGYLDFKTPSDTDGNKSRWETAPWWMVFLDRAVKSRFQVKRAAVKSLETVKAWLTRQAAQSVAMVFDAIEKECRASGLDVRRVQKRFIYGLVEEGRGRYKSKHRVMLGGFVPSLSGGLSL